MYWSNDNKCELGNLGIKKSSKAMFSLRSLKKGKQCEMFPIRNKKVRASIRALMRYWPEFIPHVVYLKSEAVSRVHFWYLNNIATIPQLQQSLVSMKLTFCVQSLLTGLRPLHTGCLQGGTEAWHSDVADKIMYIVLIAIPEQCILMLITLISTSQTS